MDEYLEIGDVVYLKSEPQIKLTVVTLHTNNRVEAVFYNKDKQEFQSLTGGDTAFEKVKD